MKIVPGNLVKLNSNDAIPVWKESPGSPLPPTLLAGHVFDDDVMLVLETLENGTSRVMTRHGFVWIVTYFIKLFTE